jgi:hypothetical protein
MGSSITDPRTNVGKKLFAVQISFRVGFQQRSFISMLSIAGEPRKKSSTLKKLEPGKFLFANKNVESMKY